MSAAIAIAIAAIPPPILARLRAAGIDDFGNEIVATTKPDGGYPLRCCLRESAPGERIALIAYQPFPWPGVYAEVGPVFIHADECGGYQETDTYPEGFRHRQQIFRAYGLDRTMAAAGSAERRVGRSGDAGSVVRRDCCRRGRRPRETVR